MNGMIKVMWRVDDKNVVSFFFPRYRRAGHGLQEEKLD